MNDRERWNRVMHFQSVDHVPDMEFGYWGETLPTWREQGLPPEIDSPKKADDYFGFVRDEVVCIDMGPLPVFKEEVVYEDERHAIVVSEAGYKYEVLANGSSAIPHYIEYPLKNREVWQRYKERLDPKEPSRYPADWELMKKQWRDRDYPLGISMGSLFGYIRNWMGIEQLSLSLYDDPDWLEEMMEYLTDFFIAVNRRALREVEFDCALFWEDMACRAGPLISPKTFQRLMVPRYQRITSLLKEHGIDVVVVDCDGNINQLVHLWLEGGVNCMFPLEIRGGSDPLPIREKYGRNVLLKGGVDKTALIAGKEAIRQDVKRIEKLVAMGGYIPHVDHRVPPDVTFENYLYYLDVKREALGIPKPAPFKGDFGERLLYSLPAGIGDIPKSVSSRVWKRGQSS